MTSRRSGHHSPGVPFASEVALVLPALAAGVGLGRLGTAPGAWGVVAPIGLAVLVGHGATAVVARRLGAVAGAIAGVAGVGLFSLWWFLPSQTAWGLPTGATVDAAGARLREAWALIRAEPTPVHAVPPIVLCMAIGAGLTAVCARSLLFTGGRGRRDGALLPVPALVPTAVLFGYASLLDSGSDRAQATLAYVGTAAVFAFAAGQTRRTTGISEPVVTPGPPHRHLVSAPLVLVTGLAAAMVVPLLAAPSLSAMRPRPFVASAGGGIGTGSAVVPFSGIIDSSSLVDDLGAVLAQRPHQLLFVAHSPVATYWQVATLTTYEDGRWLADPETTAAVEGTPLPGLLLPQLPQPAATAFYDASVTVENMQSELLPVPPAAVAVTDARRAQLVPGLGARLLSGSSYEMTYRVQSAQASRPATRAPSSAELDPYLELPRLAPQVVALTRQVLGTAHSPLAKAEALAAFFARGGFRYSLDVEIPGPDPLVGFLFQTRTGFCQQFAGAYGVMARLAGLPTRLAVGFTAGSLVSGAYQVTGADAHVWPQVYLGRKLGWVSVDPTPAAPGVVTIRAPEVLVANAVGDVGAAGLPIARFAPHGSAPSATAAPPSPPTTTAARARAAAGADGAGVVWWFLGALVLALVAVRCRDRLTALVRRARWRRLPPERAVVAMWLDAAGAMGRYQYETPHEHAIRVSPRLDGDAAAFVELARLAAWAGYSGEEVTTDHRDRARRLHSGVTRR